MDVLSEIISSSGLQGSLLARHSFFGKWGFRFPCERSFGFHIITQGNCFIRHRNTHSLLEKGDIAFIAKGCSHDLVSSPTEKTKDIKYLIADTEKKSGYNQHPSCTIISVRYEPTETVHPFFHELPDFILVQNQEIPAHHPIHSALILISSEMDSGGSSELILHRLSDILLYYILKYWADRNSSAEPGWVRTMKDEKILYVLDLLHRDISRDWTLDSISDSVGISRASLANKFRESLGITPLDYLSRVRIEKGRRLLQEKNYTLEEIARKVGYSNAFSFSKAYKRVRGVSPKTETA